MTRKAARTWIGELACAERLNLNGPSRAGGLFRVSEQLMTGTRGTLLQTRRALFVTAGEQP